MDACWTRLQQQGWDHPAWREAYCLGQLCLAFAYTASVTSSSHANRANAKLHHQSSLNGSKIEALLAPDTPQQAAPSHVAPPQCNIMSDSASETGAPSNVHQPLSTASTGQPQANADNCLHAIEAMKALDMTSIMGGPPEMLQPFTAVIEPQARRCHQAAMACQHNGNPDNVGSLQLSDARPANKPQLSLSSSIARQQLQDLSPAAFRKMYWKTDTPVIVTGLSNIQHSCTS